MCRAAVCHSCDMGLGLLPLTQHRKYRIHFTVARKARTSGLIHLNDFPVGMLVFVGILAMMFHAASMSLAGGSYNSAYA